MGQEYYFSTEKLTVGYQGLPLIKNIEICLKKGEILTLIGPNGAGKTTILKSLIRQLKPLGGAVFLDGKSVEEFTGREFAKKLSVVLTERVRPELMSCQDVVATGRYPYTGKFGVLSGDDRKIVKESMELVHISEIARKDFTKISDGQKQRVMLARALCQQPDILVLDEPTSFLDIRYKLEFLSIIQNMARTGKLLIVMSMHELELAGKISDKVACVKGDRIDRFGSPEEIFTDGYMAELYQMTEGFYDERSGNPELPPVKGAPKVFVIAGNGMGAPIFRKLQRAGIPFAAGILWENDLDYPPAKALAAEVVSEKAFQEMGEEKLFQAKKLIDACEKVISAVDVEALGNLGKTLKELLEYARERGKISGIPEKLT